MKILLLFVTVVCAVQPNIDIQVVQEVGEDGYGDHKGRGDGGGGEGGRGGGGGEGGGGGGESVLRPLKNHLIDLYKQLIILEDQIIKESNIKEGVNNFLNEMDNLMSTLYEAESSAESDVSLEICDPGVDLNGDLDIIIVNIFGALEDEFGILATSLDATKYDCYMNRLDIIKSEIESRTLGALNYEELISSAYKVNVAAKAAVAALDDLIVSIMPEIADLKAQITEAEDQIAELEAAE